MDDTFQGLERISNIVGSVKQFAHPGQDASASADLNEAIRNTIAVSTNEWKYVANVETELDPTLPLIHCNISSINQVILNLIVNAPHAIADQQMTSGVTGKGTITLKTRNLGDFAEIRITDTGPGIPESIRPRIFDPFLQLKVSAKGVVRDWPLPEPSSPRPIMVLSILRPGLAAAPLSSSACPVGQCKSDTSTGNSFG